MRLEIGVQTGMNNIDNMGKSVCDKRITVSWSGL